MKSTVKLMLFLGIFLLIFPQKTFADTCQKKLAISKTKSVTAEELMQMVKEFEKSPELAAVDQAFKSLPRKGSKKWKEIIEDVHLAMDEPGFAQVDLREYLPESIFDELYEAFPVAATILVTEGGSINPHANLFLVDYPESWVTTFLLRSKSLQVFARFSNWVEALIAEALPDEPGGRSRSELRISTDKGGVGMMNWHPDPENAVTATITLAGKWGTDIKHKSKIIKTARGVLTCLSGGRRLQSVEATIHRSPPDSTRTKRTIFVWRK